MIKSSVRIVSVNGDRYNGPAVFFEWNAEQSVDAVFMHLNGPTWIVDFEMLVFGGNHGGDIAITHLDTVVECVLMPPGQHVEVLFDRNDIVRFVEFCVDETEERYYSFPEMRREQVEYLLESILGE
jgi:hypothetical protein